MSAFFVDKETIDKAVFCFRLDDFLHPSYSAHVDNLDEFGKRCWRLNIEAMKHRYRIDAEEQAGYEAEVAAYRYDLTTFPPAVALKGLRCLKYQCAEGTVPETALFHQLEAIDTKISKALVAKLPEYEEAAWG